MLYLEPSKYEHDGTVLLRGGTELKQSDMIDAHCLPCLFDWSMPCKRGRGADTHPLSADGTAVLNGQAGFVLEAPWINSSTTHHNPRPDGLVNETYHKPGVAHDPAPGTSRQMD